MALTKINHTPPADSAVQGAIKLDTAFTAIDANTATVATQGTTLTSHTASLATLTPRIVSETFIQPSGDTSGATDTAAIQAYYTAAAAALRTSTGISAPVGTLNVMLGNGDLFFNASALNGNPTKAIGVRLSGRGKNRTAVHYTPTVPGTPMFVNNRWLDFEVADLSFVGNDANADFLQSLEQNSLSNIQDNRFDAVEWIGSWQNIFMLCGGNNNSEWKINDCSVTGNGGFVQNWLYIPDSQTATFTASTAAIAMNVIQGAPPVGSSITFGTTVGNIVANTGYFVVASTTGSPGSIQVSATNGGSVLTPSTNGTAVASFSSDQFLNYWFSKCKFTSQKNSSWINVAKGGSISIRDSDISANSPTSSNYIFQLLEPTHAGGVCNFTVDHLRIEHASNSSLLLHSQWPQGNITFRGLDQSSQDANRPSTQNYVLVERVNTGGSIITFDGCQLMGTHTYNVNSNDTFRPHKAIYHGCTLLDNPSPADFIINTLISNSGGFIDAQFDQCRPNLNFSTTGYREVIDSAPNWYITAGGQAKRRSMNMVSSSSDWPQAGGNFHIRIPRHALILGIWFWKPSTGNTGAFQYTLTTNEASPTTLAGGAATAMAGSNAGATILPTNLMSSALNGAFWCDTDLKRELILTDTLAGTRTGIFTGVECQVEYLG